MCFYPRIVYIYSVLQMAGDLSELLSKFKNITDPFMMDVGNTNPSCSALLKVF